jgi:hypothetical protein
VWILKLLQPLLTQKKVNKNGVIAGWKILTETPSKGKARIRRRSQPLMIQEKSMKIESVLTGNRHRNTFQK